MGKNQREFVNQAVKTMGKTQGNKENIWENREHRKVGSKKDVENQEHIRKQ
jgi:hypothetical protein